MTFSSFKSLTVSDSGSAILEFLVVSVKIYTEWGCLSRRTVRDILYFYRVEIHNVLELQLYLSNFIINVEQIDFGQFLIEGCVNFIKLFFPGFLEVANRLCKILFSDSFEEFFLHSFVEVGLQLLKIDVIPLL